MRLQLFRASSTLCIQAWRRKQGVQENSDECDRLEQIAWDPLSPHKLAQNMAFHFKGWDPKGAHTHCAGLQIST